MRIPLGVQIPRKLLRRSRHIDLGGRRAVRYLQRKRETELDSLFAPTIMRNDYASAISLDNSQVIDGQGVLNGEGGRDVNPNPGSSGSVHISNFGRA